MPLRFRHWLGTTQLGQDVLAGLIHGSAMVFKVAFLAILIASFIGISAGSVAGYFGDDGFKMNRFTLIITLIGFVLGYFWAFESRLDIFQNSIDDLFSFSLTLFVSILIWFSATLVFYTIGKAIAGRWSNRKKTAVPVDLIISRVIEIFHSIPRLLLIISFSALFENRSLTAVVVLIGCTAWTGIARYMRAEMLKVRNMDYINAAKVLRFPTWKIIFKHALPNAFGPVAIEIIFALASAIMLESVLSFLSIGVPDDALTWGTLLNYGRQQFDAWWLVLFPGLTIASLVWSLSKIAEKRKAII
jgi:peptide/nickel transport system permease protein